MDMLRCCCKLIKRQHFFISKDEDIKNKHHVIVSFIPQSIETKTNNKKKFGAANCSHSMIWSQKSKKKIKSVHNFDIQITATDGFSAVFLILAQINSLNFLNTPFIFFLFIFSHHLIRILPNFFLFLQWALRVQRKERTLNRSTEENRNWKRSMQQQQYVRACHIVKSKLWDIDLDISNNNKCVRDLVYKLVKFKMIVKWWNKQTHTHNANEESDICDEKKNKSNR